MNSRLLCTIACLFAFGCGSKNPAHNLATPKELATNQKDNGPENFVLIKAETFMMGSPNTEADRNRDEGPQHQVTISNDFEIGKYEVTQQEWFDVMGSNPSRFTEDLSCPGERKIIEDIALCPNNPVESVSWNDVQIFIEKIYEKGMGKYRLPTEAEWELAARGGTQTVYSFGDDASRLGAYAWFGAGSVGLSHAVGKKLSNNYGLFDTAGNVWEWTQDAHSEYSASPVVDPQAEGNADSIRVFRGGGWRGAESGCRSANRDYDSPDFRFDNLGFRLVRVTSKSNKVLSY